MQRVVIPNTVVSIGAYAFTGCPVLQSVVLPKGLTEIAERVFIRCNSLTDIVIPEGVTRIGAGAFLGCWDLRNITLPLSLKRIDQDAFLDAGLFTQVYYAGSPEQWGQIEIADGNMDFFEWEDIYYYDDSSLAVTKTKKGWQDNENKDQWWEVKYHRVPENAVVFIAFYQNGRLVTSYYEDDPSLRFSFTVSPPKEPYDQVRTMVFDSLQTLRPLSLVEINT